MSAPADTPSPVKCHCGLCAGCRRRAAVALCAMALQAHNRRHRRGGSERLTDDAALVLAMAGLPYDPYDPITGTPRLDGATEAKDRQRSRATGARSVPVPGDLMTSERSTRLRLREAMWHLGRKSQYGQP